MTSAIADVISVPTTRAHAPYWLAETSQLLSKTKPMTPKRSNAGLASTYSRMKKKAMRARIPAASPLSPHRRRRSGNRATGDRSKTERPPAAGAVPAAISPGLAAQRLAVALQGLDLRLGRGVDRRRLGRVGQLWGYLLAGARGVVQPALDPLGLALGDAGLAHVLVDDHERRGGDRIAVRRRRVDRVEAQVVRDLEALDRRGRRVQRRRDVLACLVLDRGVGEVVLERVGLLDVADRALVLLDARGDAVVALGAGARRPLDRLVDADVLLPLRRISGEEGREELRRTRFIRAVADRDVRVRDLYALVLSRDRRVVPLLDLAEEDVGNRRPVELEALGDPGDVVRDGDGARHGGDVDRGALLRGRLDLVIVHGRVGGAEVDRAGGELGNAAARADGLVVDRRAGRVLVARGPLGVDRGRERRPGSVDGAAPWRAAGCSRRVVLVVVAAGTARGDAEREHAQSGQRGDQSP